MVYTSKLPAVEEPKTGVIQFIFANTNNTPKNKPFLIDALNDRLVVTYSQLKDFVLQFGAGLQDVCNFNSNDVLALYAPNQYNYLIPVLGALAANGITTTANPNYNVEELTHQLEMTNAKVLICHQNNVETALQASERAGILRKNIFVFGEKTIKGIQPFQTALIRTRKAIPEELTYEQAKNKVAFLCYSSGTTGKSKGAMITHANVTANTRQYASFDGPLIDHNKDKMIGVLPFFHIYGLTCILFTALLWGTPIYVLPYFDLVKFCETVEKHKITFACLVPPIYLLLAKHETVSNYDLSSLRIGISGAAPLSGDIARMVKSRLPNLIIQQGYGLTETCSVIVQPADCAIAGSCGVLLANMLAKVVDENGNEVPQGERGELWLKGPSIMKGYINNSDATADCIDTEGYFHTGDIVVVDKDQNFYIVDRIKELIKYKGFQVPPAELEGILLKSPIIADCAVIGVYDAAQASEIPCAYVILNPHVEASNETAKQIMDFVAHCVAPYKQIRAVRFVDAIPKSPSGKILRRVLRDAALEEAKDKTITANKSKI